MSEHSQDQTTAAATPQTKPEPQRVAGETGGVQALKLMLSHGRPQPEDVAKLFARYTYDRDTMLTVLYQSLGTSYTREVVEAVKFAAELKEAKDPVADRTKHDVAVDMKKGTIADTRTATHVQDDGEAGKTTVTNTVGGSAGHIGPNGEVGAALNGQRAKELEAGEGNSVKNVTGGGVQVTQNAVGAKINHEKEVNMGGQQRVHGADAGGSIDYDGKIETEGAIASTKGDSKGSKTNSINGGYSTEGGAAAGGQHVVKTTVGTNPDGTPIQSAKSVGGKIHVGGETSGGSISGGSTNANGTASSANAGVDFGEGGVSAHAGYSIMTKEGSGVSASVSHGTKVVAKPPEFNLKTKQWEVAYVRTTTNGANVGGSLGKGGFGVGLGGGASESHFDSGVKTFTNPMEAYSFTANAAEELGEPMFDPGTALGALMLPVGETIGSGTSSAVSVNGSISFEGATIGGGGSSSETHEMDVKRVDTQHVQVTVLVAGEEEKHIGISGNGMSDTKSQTDDTNKAITYQFDLLNPASREAYERFCKDRKTPDKALGVWIRTERTKSSQAKDDIGFIGGVLDQNWTGTTKEAHVQDAKGDHDQYDGTRANDVTTGRVGHFLGDKNSHASANLEANVENGKETSYTATIEVGGESGSRNREALNQWFAMGDAKGTDATTSGNWKLTADVSVDAVHKLENDVHDFKGKTPEQKQRILSEMVAKSGGVNIHDGKPLDWDVELAGDPNFPGAAGRRQLDAKLKQYGDQLKTAPKDAGPVLANIDGTIKELATRYTAIDDRAKYTDLPGELRHKVLDQIMRYITSFKTLRSKAQTDVMAQHTTDASHNGKLAAEQTRLDTANTNIVHDHAAVMVADKAVNQAKDHFIAGHKDEVSAALSNVHEYRSAALALNQRQMQLDGPIEVAREAYLHSSDPATAIEAVLKPTEEKASLLATMLMQLCDAASSLKPVTTENGIHGHEAFWATIPGEVGSVASEGDDG